MFSVISNLFTSFSAISSVPSIVTLFTVKLAGISSFNSSPSILWVPVFFTVIVYSSVSPAFKYLVSGFAVIDMLTVAFVTLSVTVFEL